MKSALLAAVAALALAVPATAQDTITLKVAHPLPETHFSWQLGIKRVLDTITEQTNGRVQFEVYPGNQLGRDTYGLLKSGIADMAMIVPVYMADKFPLTAVTEFPGFYDSTCEASAKYQELAKPGGPLDVAEYAPQGLKTVFVTTTAPQRYMTATKKVASLEEAAGAKIYAAGAALGKSVRAVGSVAISITASELYDSVNRGTVDGALFPYSSTDAYKLGGILRNEVGGIKFGVTSWFVAMGERSFDALPPEVQEVVLNAGLSVEREFCAFTDNDDARIRQELSARGDLTINELSDEQKALWLERLAAAAEEWAAEMDAAGLKGTELLAAMRNAGAGQ